MGPKRLKPPSVMSTLARPLPQRAAFEQQVIKGVEWATVCHDVAQVTRMPHRISGPGMVGPRRVEMAARAPAALLWAQHLVSEEEGEVVGTQVPQGVDVEAVFAGRQPLQAPRDANAPRAFRLLQSDGTFQAIRPWRIEAKKMVK